MMYIIKYYVFDILRKWKIIYLKRKEIKDERNIFYFLVLKYVVLFFFLFIV